MFSGLGRWKGPGTVLGMEKQNQKGDVVVGDPQILRSPRAIEWAIGQSGLQLRERRAGATDLEGTGP